MKQSRLMSFIESALSTLAGFGLSLFCQWLFLPMLGVAVTFTQNIAFAIIMTFVSIGRQFIMRRIFEALHIRRPLSPFMEAAIAERFRQIEVKGYDAAHDAAHSPRELARAACAYLVGPNSLTFNAPVKSFVTGYMLWPWRDDEFKPDALRDDLVRGAALALAAGDLADRQRKNKSSPPSLNGKE